MPHVSMLGTLAEIRQRELIAEADRYRLARLARDRREPWWRPWLRAWQRRGLRRRPRPAAVPCP